MPNFLYYILQFLFRIQVLDFVFVYYVLQTLVLNAFINHRIENTKTKPMRLKLMLNNIVALANFWIICIYLVFVRFQQIVNEDNKARVRAQIGSRPPKCEGMCSSCGPCEAIQVPNNFQAKPGKRNSSSVVSAIAYARGNEYSSNYKPMSWKCKCGTIIFNP